MKKKTKKNDTKIPIKKKPIVVAVSGGFDPLHIGHVRMFNEAKKLGGKLVVILNNDHWLRQKKGSVFMPEAERREIIEALRAVDEVVLTSHPEKPEDMSVCRELKIVRPDIFAQGGDRNVANIPPCEVALQRELGFLVVENVGRGGKVQSSSWLLKRYKEGKEERA
ncbi:MAG: adenylyltransferase/cytidyltransferase family protein [Candidatus Taylorbacteria bacterium]|nr:adenylyltransferase/cytidyltransferase family protein [Candidatus Taylorbacteria bacterium]